MDNRILMVGIRDTLKREVLLNESVLDDSLQWVEEFGLR